MTAKYDALPPPIWYPAMAVKRDRVALTAYNVEEFVDWVGSAPMIEVEAVRSAIAAGCDDEVVAIIGRELNRLPIVDTSRHNVLLSILGESRRESAIRPLEQFVWNVVDVLSPIEVVAGSVLSEKVVCDIGVNFGFAFRARAAEMLTHIGSASAFEGAVRVIREHPEAVVRRAAIDAYLYNRGDTAEAVREARRQARDEDQEWVGIPRRTLDTNPDEMRERVARLTRPAPTPAPVPRPDPPAYSEPRGHVSAKPPEF